MLQPLETKGKRPEFADVRDAIGDIGVFMCDLCNRRNIPFTSVTFHGFEEQIAEMAKENAAWTAHNFPNGQSWMPALGIGEELGELASALRPLAADWSTALQALYRIQHAELKLQQGIRGSEFAHLSDMATGLRMLANLLNTLAVTMFNCSFETITLDTWCEVRKRDWIANPVNGK